MNTFLIVSLLFTLVLVAGLCINFYHHDDAESREAEALLDYLEKSECNLFYNSTVNAWGLVDGQDKLIAAGRSLRAALLRAQHLDMAQRVADDFTNAEQAQAKRAPAASNTVAKS